MSELYPPFRAAAAQASSVWLDPAASTVKACALIEEAGRGGADIVALPESFIPGFPYWVFVKPLSETGPWHVRLHDQAVEITGPTIDALAAAAKRSGVYAVVGITERNPGIIADSRGRSDALIILEHGRSDRRMPPVVHRTRPHREARGTVLR